MKMLLLATSKHIFIFVLLITVVSSEETDAKRTLKRNASDLPSKSDIWKYVNALDKILNFCIKNKNEIDLNLYFGLFLVNVNLRPVVNEKSSTLPLDLRVKVVGILKKCTYICKFFDQMVQKDKSPEDEKTKLIYTLMNQEDEWLDRMKRFHTESWKQPNLTPSQQEHKFSNWNKYLKDIGKFEKWVPSPNQSDTCLVSLARNPHKITDTLTKCKVNDICYVILLNGNDFGYALTHRLVLMVLARMGRGCYLFTPELDNALTKRFCGTLYSEANFIARNNYTQAADLLFEQMVLCILKGHEKFLQKHLLLCILELQTPNGCVSTSLTERNKAEQSIQKEKENKYLKWKFLKKLDSQDIEDEHCNSHITGLAAAVHASAIKYIIQHDDE